MAYPRPHALPEVLVEPPPVAAPVVPEADELADEADKLVDDAVLALPLGAQAAHKSAREFNRLRR